MPKKTRKPKYTAGMLCRDDYGDDYVAFCPAGTRQKRTIRPTLSKVSGHPRTPSHDLNP